MNQLVEVELPDMKNVMDNFENLNFEEIKIMLENGADINFTDENGDNLLFKVINVF